MPRTGPHLLSAARQPAEAPPLHLHRVWRFLPEHRTGPLAAQMPVGLFWPARGLTAPEQKPCSTGEMPPPTEGNLPGKGAGRLHKTQKAVPVPAAKGCAAGLMVRPMADGRKPHDPAGATKAPPGPRAATATTTVFTSTTTSTPPTPGRMAQADITPGCDTPASGTTATGMITADFSRSDGPDTVTAE